MLIMWFVIMLSCLVAAIIVVIINKDYCVIISTVHI